MDDITLEKTARDSDGKVLRREECTVWTDDATLAWCRVAPEGTDEGEEELESADGAERAAREMIARLEREGFVPEGEPAPLLREPPSRAKQGVAAPSWITAGALVTQRRKLRRLAKSHGLEHRMAEIEALTRPVIDLRLRRARAAELKAVVSRVGGEPDLPAGRPWPEHGGAPLTFVAQIVLDEAIKALDLENLLPAAGLLSFFAQLDPGAAEMGERGAVLYAPEVDGLVRRAPPSRACVNEKIGVLTPKLRLAVAPSETQVVIDLALNSDEQASYHDELFLGPVPEGRRHMLLGWPDATTHRDVPGTRFLAQFDSDHRIDLQMGDHNTLRYYIGGDTVTASSVKRAACTLMEA